MDREIKKLRITCIAWFFAWLLQFGLFAYDEYLIVQFHKMNDKLNAALIKCVKEKHQIELKKAWDAFPIDTTN